MPIVQPIFNITTTGLSSPVIFYDLGERTFTHPTVAFNLASEYTIEEIKNSTDLANALDSGFVTAELNGTPILTSEDLETAYVLTSDDRLFSLGVLRVKLNPGLGEFGSIADAIASITLSDENNRFIIEVGPGTWIEPLLDLTTKPYVSIVGSSIQETIIKPLGNHHIFSLGIFNELSFMWLEGATAGYAGIACIDSGDYSQVHKVTFNNCDIGILVTASTQDTFFYGEYIDYNGEYSYGTKVISSGGFTAFANLENYYNYPVGLTIPTVGTYISGDGAEVHILTSGNTGVSLGTAFYIEDGGELELNSATIDSWDKGIHVPNIGTAPIIVILGTNSKNCVSDDFLCSHPGTTGSIQGTFDMDGVTNNSSNVSIDIQHINEGSLNISKKLNILFSGGQLTDMSTLITESSTMGLIEGGELSVPTGGGLYLDISAGFGYVETSPDNDELKRFDWNDTNILLSANSVSYVYFNNLGVLTTSGSLPNTFFNILLGKVVTNATDVEILQVTPLLAEHASNRFSKANRLALGPIYATGSIVTENSTPFHLDVTPGQYFFSTCEYNPIGGTDINFRTYYQDGSGGWIKDIINVVDNNFYDDGSGTLAAMTSDYYAKHSLYIVGDGADEKYLLVYAQSEWPTLLQVQESTLSIPPSYFNENISLIAAIIVQAGVGVTNITQIRDLRPTVAFRSEGVNAASNHGSLLGLLNDDHPQYLRTDGARTATGSINLGGYSIFNAYSIGLTSLPTGSIPFADGSNILISNSNLFWDNNNNRLGIGTSTPTVSLDVIGSVKLSGTLTVGALSGVIKASVGVVSGGATTTDLPEGTNLYFTDGRAQTAITGGASTIVTSNLTTNRALISNGSGKVAVSVTTDSELAFVSGVTSALQTQLNNKQPLDSTLTSLAAYNTNGILVQTAADTFTGRTITGVTDRITITNGDGVISNPIINISVNYVGQTSITTLGTITTGTWNATTISVAKGGTGVTTFGGTNTILYTTAADTLASITTANDGILVTSGTGVPSIGGTIPIAVQTNITRLGTITSGTITNAVTVTLRDSLFTIQDDSDTSKQLVFQLSGITTATTRTITIPNYSGVPVLRDSVLQSTLQTTDATVTTIQTVATATDKSYLIEARVISRKASGGGTGTAGDTNTYIRTFQVKNVGGTLTIGTVQSTYTEEDINQHNVTVTSSGTNVLIQATGTASNTVNWIATTEITIL